MPARYIALAAGTAVAALLSGVPANGASIDTLYAFKGYEDRDGGVSHTPLLVGTDGALYGVTSNGGGGGCPSFVVGCGTAFKLVAPAAGGTHWVKTILHSFGSNDRDGANPSSGLIADATGALYGTTSGGGFYGGGTVYKLTPPVSGTQWTQTVLHAFGGGADGEFPSGGLIMDHRGALYGTTRWGGGATLNCSFGCGTVFRLMPPRPDGRHWRERVLYAFQDGADGAFPDGGVMRGPDHVLYGTTKQGGGTGGGTVFMLTPPPAGSTTWAETVIHAFPGSGQPGSDGQTPVGRLIKDGNGVLYGVTQFGGTSGAGMAFSLAPPSAAGMPWTETALYSFKGGADAANPGAGLIAGARGRLFGTSSQGGVANSCTGCGTIYELLPWPGHAEWGERVMHTFTSGIDGANPYAVLTPGADDLLYGSTSEGGMHAWGTVFSMKR